MQAKRFVAADMRRALDMVKEEFGEEAMIVSTERTARGVEIVASLETAFQALVEDHDLATMPVSPHQQNIANAASRFTSTAMPHVPAANTQAHSSIGMASGKTKQQLAEEMDIANRKMLASRKAENMTIGEWANQPPSEYTSAPVEQTINTPLPTPSHAHAPVQSVVDNEEIKRLHNEIADMRDTLEVQLMQMAETQERQYIESLSYAAVSSPDVSSSAITPPVNGNTVMPIVSDIKYQLTLMGLPHACNDQLIASIKDNNMPINNKQLLWTHVMAELSKKIPSDLSDPIASGGIYSFLGTTGVGKTTTIAKLAARHVMAHGSDSVVLLTTDTYRIAAHNQLQSLAKILNVTVKVIENLQDLPRYINECSHHSLVLIDTPGMGHNDPLLKQHLHILRECKQVKNMLVLSANSQYQMLKASLHSYRLAGLHSCVLTKLDECANLGDAIGVLYEQDLALSYTTDGQSVPKDLAITKPSQLITQAVNMVKQQRRNKLLEQKSI
jgi:flagellar biosynthesis protein FlhF